MLKNVVLPAPLGPMIETIERSGTPNETSLLATRPPKRFVTCSALSSSGRSASGTAGAGPARRRAHARTS